MRGHVTIVGSLVLFLSWSAFAGSQTARPATAPAVVNPKMRELTPAKVDGKLVAFWVQRRTDEPTTIIGDYAIVTIWDDKERRFILYDTAAGRIQETNDFDVFIEMLGKVRSGATLQHLDKCSVSFAWRMPDEKRAQIADAIDRRKLVEVGLADDGVPKMVCTCESHGLRFPATK